MIASRRKAIILYLFPAVILVYFVIGAISGEIAIPGRSGVLSIGGKAAWIACLSPLLWLVGDIFLHDPAIKLENITRRLLSGLAWLAGIAILFFAIIQV